MTRPDIIVEVDDLTPEKRYPLKSLAERLAALRPTRVIVNHGGPSAYLAQVLRDYGLPVEAMKKPAGPLCPDCQKPLSEFKVGYWKCSGSC